MVNKKWLKSISPEVGGYIAGFTDGEGSFNVSLRKREDHKIGWQVVPSFNVSQKDRVILSWLKRILNCGTLRERKDGVVYYEARNLNALADKIIPFFHKFSFRSAAKKKNFSIFEKIVKILIDKPLDEKTLRQIVELREELNLSRGRTRKYELRNVFPLKANRN